MIEQPAPDHEKRVLKKPFEIECVPYTRDIGRFDPQEEEAWDSSQGWSRIGKDYLSLISFEKIGILRIEDPNVDICYRVQVCKKCHELFDVYANYSVLDGECASFRQLWPHLFGPEDAQAPKAKPLNGQSYPMWLISQLGRPFRKSEKAGAILLSLLLLGFGLIPWLFNPPGANREAFHIELLLHTIVVISVCMVLLISNHYAEYLKKSKDFQDALIVKKASGLSHWRNFTLCRLTGAQKGTGFPRPSQVDVFAGGGAVLSLIFTWAIVRQSWAAFILGLFILALILLLFVDLRVLHIEKPLRFLSPIITVIAVIALGLLWMKNPGWLSWEALHRGVILAFWIMVAYFLGTGTLLTESMASYVLITLSRIPMRLSPYNQFLHIKPLRRIQSYATWLILLLFLTMILVIAVILTFKSLPAYNQAASQWNWLVTWLSLALALIFGMLGVGGKRPAYLVVVGIYLMLYTLSQNWTPQIKLGSFTLQIFDPPLTLSAFEFTIQGSLLIVGGFLSFLLVQHLVSTEGIVSRLIETTKGKFLRALDRQIANTHTRLESLGYNEASPQEDTGVELQELVETLINLLKLREEVEKSQNNSKNKTLQSLSPIVSSFIFPILTEKILLPILGTVTHLKLN